MFFKRWRLDGLWKSSFEQEAEAARSLERHMDEFPGSTAPDASTPEAAGPPSGSPPKGTCDK